jgi:cellulose biosynthesis protein BcsQ
MFPCVVERTMMNTRSHHTQDITRLCEVLGVDPTTYVAFERRRIASRQPSNDRKSSHSLVRARKEAPEPKRVVPVAYSAFDAISPELLDRSGIARYSPRYEANWGKRPAIEPTQIGLLSIAGGTGKTTIAAMLGRVLSARGHSVLLADHSPDNAMHDVLGTRKDISTAISFATGTGAANPVPIVSQFEKGNALDDFEAWFSLVAARTSLTFLDGRSDAVTAGRELIGRGARILVPVLPDFISNISTMHLDQVLHSPSSGRVNYVLNRFDASHPVHIEARSRLREYLGDRLLPFEIEEDAAVREVAAGAVAVTDLPAHSAARRGLESFAEWLETACDAKQAKIGEVVR